MIIAASLVCVGVAIKDRTLPLLTFYLTPPESSPLPIPVPQKSASPKPAPILIHSPGAEVNLDNPIGQKGFGSYVQVTGTLSSPKFCNDATLNFLVYDSDGNQLGVDPTTIQNLKAGELWQFSVFSSERGAYQFQVDSFECRLIAD